MTRKCARRPLYSSEEDQNLPQRTGSPDVSTAVVMQNIVVSEATSRTIWSLRKAAALRDWVLFRQRLLSKLNGVGHLILVVAERSGIDRISTSIPSYASFDTIRRIMRNMVRVSSWMGDQESHFVKGLYENVSRQLYDSNAYGTYVILNDWAYLLVAVTRGSLHREMQLINITLRGHTNIKLLDT